MYFMKRVRLVVLFLVAAAFVASTSAHAADRWTPFTSTGAEPTASGAYSLHLTSKWSEWRLDVTVRCAGLTPGETYHVTLWLVDTLANGYWPFPVPVASLTADAAGNGGVTIRDFRLNSCQFAGVDVSNAGDAVILTTSQY